MQMTVLSSAHLGELLQPGHPKNLTLFHADPTDAIGSIPIALGKGYVQEIEFGNGLSLLLLDCEFTQDFHQDIIWVHPALEFEFCLSGTKPGTNTTILHLDHLQPLQLLARQRYQSVKVVVTSPRLERYFSYMLEQMPVPLRQTTLKCFEQIYQDCWGDQATTPQLAMQRVLNQPLLCSSPAPVSQAIEQVFDPQAWHELAQILNGANTPAMQTALDHILRCPYQGVMRQSYLESKALELVTLRLAQMAQNCQSVYHPKLLSSGDIEKIHAARDILLCHLKTPPSLLSLARQVGLNDCTLKRGFRQVFGMSAFDCLRHYRMERALQLLNIGEMAVSQVAHQVGYTSRSSFYTAFRKQFGLGPRQYLTQKSQQSKGSV